MRGRLAGIKIDAQVGDKHLAVVQAAIPSENKASAGDVRLFLTVRFNGGVKKGGRSARWNRPRRLIHRPGLLLQGCAKILDQLSVDWSAVEIPIRPLERSSRPPLLAPTSTDPKRRRSAAHSSAR